ncbi:MAG TPA: PhzF family phenazine biosynthesis protein [Gemmatimonadaceae bacterium]|nr:PhzF family phenazine biosynthesis protein [Gemmatimonadaceae bacterium]
MKFRFITTDVFTARPFTGNQLAVVTDARGIPEDSLLAIAREFNYSETTFVYPPDNAAHARRVRIFTPGAEVPFAGHPTIGTAVVLARIGEIPLTGDETRIMLEEGVGPVPVVVRARDGVATSAQLSVARLPEIGPPPPARTTLAEMLSLEPSQLLGGPNGPQAVSCGLPFLIVPVKDRAAVAAAKVRMDVWERTLSRYWAPDVMVVARDPELEGSHLRARVFVPGLSVPEDPATGSCAAALAGYLAARETAPNGSFHWVMEQGFEMGRPSILELEAEKRDGAVVAVRVAGDAVLVSDGMMEIA